MTLQGERVAQIVRVLSYGEGGIWPNHHITFIVAEKAQFTVSHLWYMWGRGLVENVIRGKGVAENVRIPPHRGRGLKLLK